MAKEAGIYKYLWRPEEVGCKYAKDIIDKVEKGLTYAYRDRKAKKRTFRALWILRINAGVRQYGMSYSEFMGKVLKSDISLNRKVLADLAENHPNAFKAVVEKVKS